MKTTCSPVGRRTEILASDVCQAVPVTVAGEETVKAGMPVTIDGAPAPAGTNAAGILLYDVDPGINPNGAMVVQGVVNWSRCRENGASADAKTMSTVLPGIVFRENAGTAQSGN